MVHILCVPLLDGKKKMMIIVLVFDLLMRRFFGECFVCHSLLCLLISGSYSKTHVSSPAITRSMRSGQFPNDREILIRCSTDFPSAHLRDFFWHYFYFSHIQMGCQNSMDNVIIRAQLICNKANCQPSVYSHKRSHSFYILI